MPKVSVIVPIYNVGKYIERCARSLFEQTLSELEFIFIDDCSPDNSIEVLQSVLEDYPERKHQVKLIRHNTNLGVSRSRQDGVDVAEGDYMIHCDPDDWVERDMYSNLLNAAIENDADVAVCGYYVNYPEYQKAVTEKYSRDHHAFLMQIINGSIHNSLWNKLIRRSLFFGITPLFTPGLNLWEDVSMLARVVSQAKSVAVVDKALYHYSQTNVNAYTRKWKPQYSENIDAAVRINVEYFSKKEIDTNCMVSRGLYSILAHESNENRKKYLSQYRDEGLLKKVDYSYFSAYGKVLARCLFSGCFTLADCVIRMRSVLKRILNK